MRWCLRWLQASRCTVAGPTGDVIKPGPKDWREISARGFRGDGFLALRRHSAGNDETTVGMGVFIKGLDHLLRHDVLG